jgi:hypothetical protein
MGNKNSGRRPMSVEMKRHATIDKAWMRVDKLLDEPGKMGDIVAKDMVTKDQTTRIEGKGFANEFHQYIIVRADGTKA